MVRYVTTQSAPASTVLNRLDDPNAANLPEAYKDAAANAYQAASAQYNNSFSSRHPIASKGLASLGGLLLGGPTGALLGPMILNKAEDNRKAGLVSGYQNALSALNAQQKDLLPTQQSGYETGSAYNSFLNHGIEPPFEKGAFLSHDAAKNFLDAGTANATLDNSTARIQNAQNNAFSAYGGFGQGHQQIQGVPGNQAAGQLPGMPVGEDNPLSGNINNQPLMPYQYMDPSAVTSTIGQIGSITGQAPNDYATLQKLSPEIAKIYAEQQNQNAQVGANNALAGQRMAQTKTEAFKPQLLKAQANAANSTAAFNARRYSGGPATQQPTVAALMQKNYLLGAYGKPGTPEAISAFQSALANDPSGYSTETKNTYDSNKKLISSSSRRVPIKNGSPQPSKPAAGLTAHPGAGGQPVYY